MSEGAYDKYDIQKDYLQGKDSGYFDGCGMADHVLFNTVGDAHYV